LNLKDKRGDTLYGEYRYTRAVTESVFTRLDMILTQNINAWISYEKNIIDNQRIETMTGFVFHRKCWSVRLTYDDKPDNRSFAFMVTLSGLGGFGTK